MSASNLKQGLSIWQIDRRKTWPPRGQVRPPIGPSDCELLRTCWLQATFQASAGYPRRRSPHARLGTAFHRTLAQLHRSGQSPGALAPRTARAQAVQVFRTGVAEQRREAMRNLRERGLPWPDDRVQRMEVTIALTADCLAVMSSARTRTQGDAGQWSKPAVEETLVSVDGLLQGRPDLVEIGASGTIIIEYKTGSLNHPDRLEAYERQYLFYAWLWHERYRTWPVEYRLANPVTGQELQAPVEPEVATALAEEAYRMVERLSEPPAADLQASTGLHCARCEFRPWCEPFWEHMANPILEFRAAKRDERISMQGIVVEGHPEGTGHGAAVVRVQNGQGCFTFQGSLSDHPHLATLRSSDSVRVLDAIASALDRTWLQLRGWSEVFTVSQ